MTDSNDMTETIITLTADIVAAHVSNNSVAVSDIPTLIANVHTALSGLGGRAPAPEVRAEPAVSIRASIKPDYIVCLDDGKKLKMLKRHLMTHYGITPDEYRAKLCRAAPQPCGQDRSRPQAGKAQIIPMWEMGGQLICLPVSLKGWA